MLDECAEKYRLLGASGSACPLAVGGFGLADCGSRTSSIAIALQWSARRIPGFKIGFWVGTGSGTDQQIGYSVLLSAHTWAMISFERRVIRIAAVAAEKAREAASDELAANFEAMVGLLRDLDISATWEEAADVKRRVLLGESLEAVYVYDDHSEVAFKGAPRINVLFAEVALKDQRSIVGVGGPIRARRPRRCSGPSSRWRDELPAAGLCS